MELSLSIASFPVDDETMLDMVQLLDHFEQDYSNVLHAPFWKADKARGFAVLAYTEEHELIGFAAAADMVGLHHYEWSIIVRPDLRRHSIGSALAEGVAYALDQRGAEYELAAFIEDETAEAFLESLGYRAGFKEIQLGAEPLESFEISEGTTIIPYDGQQEELEKLMVQSFDEEIIPLIRHHLTEDDREIWLMKNGEELVAAMTVIPEETDLWVTAFGVEPAEQGKGFEEEFLKWSRHLAFSIGKNRVLLDVETEEEALRLYGEAGFIPVNTVAYWEKAESGQK